MVKIYPELHVNEELLPDLVLKPKEKTSTSSNAASVKQKLEDSIQNFERFKDYSGIELILHNEETCLNTLRELDSAERDGKKTSCLLLMLTRTSFKKTERYFRKKMTELLKTTSHSRGQAHFLINFFHLVEKNNKLMYSKLPILSRKHGVAPNLTALKEIIKAKFRIEKYIAIKNNTEVKFQARWQLDINSSQEL